MSNGKIRVRVRIASSDRARKGEVFTRPNVEVPQHLSPKDFDWERSFPRKPWPIGPSGPEHYSWVGGWKDRPIDLVELRTEDVKLVLCSAEVGPHVPDSQPGEAAPDEAGSAITQPSSRRHYKVELAQRAIQELYPGGVPDQVNLPNKDLLKAVELHLKAQGQSISDDSILRAAGRRK
jgi:hypothetical protein